MLKRLLPFVCLLLALFLPEFAVAGTMNPLNGNAWTLYVFGNGDAIYNILTSIKLLMVPDVGDSGFNTLMMLLATVGFLVMAVQAGFDPGKNLAKLFAYILVVSAVHITTMGIVANIHVTDPVSNYDNVVVGVPALVAVPAALVSEVGHWFTKTIETYFTIPSEMTLTGGTFNLFGRLMQESNDMVISNPELKKSLSAYTADCVIPAMAQGRISASDLISSPNMTATLALATHKAILTKYFPTGTPNASGTGMTFVDSLSAGGETYEVQGGLGAVIPCEAAWTFISADLDKHAGDLVNATAAQWSKTGVMVPFEAAMSSMMAMASNGGANPFANYSKPQGYILQQALLNSQSSSFRQAAASIGNNDILMAASIAQAEQSQKSSWFTAARVFSNMMGYVYTVLQAFIFAIVPIVVIALMVPGLGKSIFTNYAQILVWLTLWQPMLSIVNYLITLFGKAQLAATMELAHGVTMQNKWTMTENTSDLMLAAQFLGTSVPLLTWGLVKGSLAFTEFISHGIGSSMAQQAGATAATGNMSLGNMSMDNTSMNKFNTAMSSAVGFQTTMSYADAAQTTENQGGSAKLAYGSAFSNTTQTGMGKAEKAAMNEQLTASKGVTSTLQALESMQHGNGFDSSDQRQVALAQQASQELANIAKVARSTGHDETAKAAESASEKLSLAQSQSASTSANLRAGTPGGAIIPVSASLETGVQNAANRSGAVEAQKSQETAITDKVANSAAVEQSAADKVAKSRTDQSTHGQTASEKSSHDFQKSSASAMQDAIQASKSVTNSLEYSLNESNGLSGGNRVSSGNIDHLRDVHENLGAEVQTGLAAGKATTGAGTSTVATPTGQALAQRTAQAQKSYDTSPANAGGRQRSLPTPAPDNGAGAGAAALVSQANQQRADAGKVVARTRAAVTETASNVKQTDAPIIATSDYPGKMVQRANKGGGSGDW